MSLRFWNAIGWGVVGFSVTICALWSFTLMDIFEVMFWAVAVYLLVIGAILLRTEPKKKKKIQPKLNPDDCPIQTLNRGDYE